MDEFQQIAIYYLHRKYHRHAQTICELGLTKSLADPSLLFLRAISIMADGNLSDGIRELIPLQDKRDLLIAAPLAIIDGHKQMDSVDMEAVSRCEEKIQIAAGKCTTRAYAMASLYCWVHNRLPEAAQFATKGIQLLESNTASNSVGAVLNALAGWIELDQFQAGAVSKVDQMLRKSLDMDNSLILSQMLRVEMLKSSGDNNRAADALSRIAITYPNYIPAFLEKLWLFIACDQWGMLADASRALDQSLMFYAEIGKIAITKIPVPQRHLDSLLATALNLICKEGGAGMPAVTYLEMIAAHLRQWEPRNTLLWLKVIWVFINICYRPSAEYVEPLLGLAKAGLSMVSKSNLTAKFNCVIGQLRLMSGQYQAAQDSFKAALTALPDYVLALQGKIECNVYQNIESDASIILEDVEKLSKIPQSAHENSRSLFIRYLASNRQRIELLLQSARLHIDAARSVAYDDIFGQMSIINPRFTYLLAEEFLEQSPSDPKKEGDPTHVCLKFIQDLSGLLSHYLAGSSEVLYILARASFLEAKLSDAQNITSSALKLDQSNAKAHLLQSQIQFELGYVERALQALDTAFSFNFAIRSIPLFHYLKAKYCRHRKMYKEALEAINEALSLPGVRIGEPAVRSISASERLAIYLESADLQIATRDLTGAEQTLLTASKLAISGSTGELMVRLRMADLYIARGLRDLDKAIAVLNEVKFEPDRPDLYQKAQYKLAEIYLQRKHDKKAYIQAYADVASKMPLSVEASILLGDAYMHIQDIEGAIQAYERLADRDQSETLTRKIGQALTRGHYFEKASKYLEEASKRYPHSEGIRYDLTRLYAKIGRFFKNEGMLPEELLKISPELSEQQVKSLLLLGYIYKQEAKYMKAVDFFMRAETQLRQLWGQSLETIEEKPIKVVLSTINYELANIYGLMKDVKKSRLAYTESANYDPSNKNALISLARMLFTSGDFEGAQQQCNNMLKADIADEEAMMMMSEIQCQKHEFAEAMQSLKKLLTDYPISWSALVLLIELTRRLGKPLVDLDPLVEKASSAIFSAKFNDSKGVSGSGDSSNAPGARLAGLAYCKGLLNRYKRNLKEALNQFNRSRFDPVFAERSVVHMVDIYLNTADITKDIESTEEGAQASMSSVMVVNTLLEDCKLMKSKRLQICRIQTNIAARQSVDQQISELNDFLKTSPHYVPALLALANAFLAQRQGSKARSVLKTIIKLEWSMAHADDYERSLLLFGELMIKDSKLDLAQECFNKCILHNQSCAKAYEYLGYLYDKQALYGEAVELYEKAWKFENESDPSIGYRLAFNYYKQRMFTDAIDVANKILAKFPSYPKIRKEILEKARQSLRPL